MNDIPPSINMIMPGLWQIAHGRRRRGFNWLIAFVFTIPLILPAIIIWILCLAEAFRLEAAQMKASATSCPLGNHEAVPPPLPTKSNVYS